MRDQRVWLHTLSPLSVRGLAVARAGRVLLPASDITLQTDIEHAKDETRVKLESLALQTAAGDRLEAQGELQMKFGDAPALTIQAGFAGSLPTLLGAYAPLGPVQTHGTLMLAGTDRTLRVERLAVDVLTPDGQKIVDLAAAEPFSLDLANGQVFTGSGRPGEVLRMQFGRIPLEAFRSCFGSLALGGEIKEGGFTVEARGGRLRLVTMTPWRVENLSLGTAGSPWLQDLSVEFEPAADYAAEGTTVTLAAVRVRNAAGASLLTGRAEVRLGPDITRLKLQGTMSFDLAVPALGAQPFLAGSAPPGQGRLSGEAKFSLDHDLLGEGRLTLNGLISPATGEPLPVANLSFRAGWGENGDVAVQLPLLIDRAGERSDLTLAASLHPAPNGRTIEANITGEHLVVDDLLALVRSFGAGPPAGPDLAPAASSRPADLRAAWAGLTGQVTVDLKSLVYGRNAEITGLTGRLVFEPARAVIDRVAGKVGADGQLQLTTEVRFAAGAPQPYASKLDFQIQGFEVGPLFKLIAPDRPPTIEGQFDIRSHAEGAGRTLTDLIENTRGDFVLQSRKGVFRGLQQAAAVTRAAGIIGSAARLLGNLGEKVENLATRADMTAELGGMLSQLPYDQLNLRLSRDQSLNIKLSDFSLVSPSVRLQGDGQITYEAGKSPLNQPMQVRVNMGVMGQVENVLARGKSSLLSGERDDLGYMKLKEPFIIGGTAGKPDPGQLYMLLGRSLLDILLH